jgi:hypothetical protein
VPCALQDGVIARKKILDVFLQPKHIEVSLLVWYIFCVISTGRSGLTDRKLCSNKFTWCFHKQNYYIKVYHSSENKLFRALCTHKDSVNESQKPGVSAFLVNVVWFTLVKLVEISQCVLRNTRRIARKLSKINLLWLNIYLDLRPSYKMGRSNHFGD